MKVKLHDHLNTMLIPSLNFLRASDNFNFKIALDEWNNNLLYVLENFPRTHNLTLLVGRLGNLISNYNTEHDDKIPLSIIELIENFSSHQNMDKLLYDLLNLQYSSIP